MGKKKLIRFAENKTFDHLFQVSYKDLEHGFTLKGRWHREFFQNDNPVTLELGCGKGEYTVFLARKYPDRNFIGVDIKGARIWRGCKTVEEENLKNVAFIRTRIQLIECFFQKDEVAEIWITFPDPQPKQKKESKRLTSPFFLAIYRQIMTDNGVIHLKTDNEGLYEYTLQTIANEGHLLLENEGDIYGCSYTGDATAIRTYYEQMFLKEEAPIKYLTFRLKNE